MFTVISIFLHGIFVQVCNEINCESENKACDLQSKCLKTEENKMKIWEKKLCDATLAVYFHECIVSSAQCALSIMVSIVPNGTQTFYLVVILQLALIIPLCINLLLLTSNIYYCYLHLYVIALINWWKHPSIAIRKQNAVWLVCQVSISHGYILDV